MERALYQNQIFIASEVASNYEMEKKFRRYSRASKLICPDSDCQSPILKYCHGEVKQAHFSHKNDCNCDYAKFDSSTPSEIKDIRNNLFHHLKKSGFEIEQEVKLIPHHYTHLVVSTSNGNKIALEIGTNKTSITNIENLYKQFSNINILLNWIVVDYNYNITQENQAFFLKRFLLNEAPQKDVILLSPFHNKITQYTEDKTEYLYENQIISVPNFSNIYSEEKSLSDLSIENNSLTINGFHQRYKLWLSKKRAAFEELKNILDEQKLSQKVQIEKETEISDEQKLSQKNQVEQETKIPEKCQQEEKILSTDSDDIHYTLLNTTEIIFKGSFRIRLCLHCNKEILASRFDPYIIYNDNPNLGCCKECEKNNIPRKF